MTDGNDTPPFYRGRRILISGGGGYIGASITRRLAPIECEIVRLGRGASSYPSIPGRATVRDVPGDVVDPDLWDRALDGVDVVFHLAAQTSVYVADRDPAADAALNVLPMVRLLETCRRRGTRPRILFAGTATEVGLPDRLPVDETADDRPVTAYDRHKLVAESCLKCYVRQRIVQGATLRLANVYGPGPGSGSADRGILNRMVVRALRGEPLTVYGTGEFLRDYVFVDDVARAFLTAGEKIEAVDGGHFLVGSGIGHTVVDAIRTVADRVFLRTGRRADVAQVDEPSDLSPIERRNFVADISRLSESTGWQPTVTLADGIDRTIEAVLGRGVVA